MSHFYISEKEISTHLSEFANSSDLNLTSMEVQKGL